MARHPQAGRAFRGPGLMPQQPIIFGNDQESGNSALAGASPLALNVLVDGKGAVRRRPGLVAYSEVPATSVDDTGVDGLLVTADDDVLVVGGGRRIFRIVETEAIELSNDATLATKLAGVAQ